MSDAGLYSHIPLQGAYIAQHCPVASQLKFDNSQEVAATPLTEAEQARVDAGVEFERTVFETIIGLHGQVVTTIEQTDVRDRMQAATFSALASGASIVLGGWLPDDVQARRIGRPDLLLRLDGGWIPIDVKHHGVTTPSDSRSERRSALQELWPSRSLLMPRVTLSGHALGDALQLAHYWRLLEASGLAADRPMGGIIGSDGVVWWIELAEPRWRRQRISALDLYDHEFRLRLDVIARQIQRNDDPTMAPLVIPLQKSECSEVPRKK